MFHVDLLLKLLSACKLKQEMPIKTIMTFLPPKLTQIFLNLIIIPIVDKGTGKQESLCFAEGNINGQTLLWKAFRKIYSKALIMFISSHPVILCRGIYLT